MSNSPLHPQMLTTVHALSKQVNCVFVSGAGGFLGQAICRQLRAANIKVVGYSRNHYPVLSELGVMMIQGDLADKTQLINAMQGCDLVFHVAAKAGVWGSLNSYHQANVIGTKHIIAACTQLKIKQLVYTSSPSVTFNGVDENFVDESAPYASRFLNHYSATKAKAEQLILQANHSMLNTVALRPHLIWGPGDPHLVPRVLQRGRAGKLALVGKQDKLVDSIYIDNAAYGHILAALTLVDAPTRCAGKAYFLSNAQPLSMKTLFDHILACDNLAPVTRRIPSSIAYAAGAIFEWVYTTLNKHQEPMITRFVARQLSTSHYYNITAAKNDFDYQPLISLEQGFDKLANRLKDNNS